MRKNPSEQSCDSVLASGWRVEEHSPVLAEDSKTAQADLFAAASSVSEPHVRADAGEDAGAGVDQDTAVPGQLSAAALVILGLLGGCYLLYTWVWISWAQYYADVNASIAATSGSVGGVLRQIVFWAVPCAPALWFVSALLLNRGAGSKRLMFWIVVGAVVLVPLPMFSGLV